MISRPDPPRRVIHRAGCGPNFSPWARTSDATGDDREAPASKARAGRVVIPLSSRQTTEQPRPPAHRPHKSGLAPMRRTGPQRARCSRTCGGEHARTRPRSVQHNRDKEEGFSALKRARHRTRRIPGGCPEPLRGSEGARGRGSSVAAGWAQFARSQMADTGPGETGGSAQPNCCCVGMMVYFTTTVKTQPLWLAIPLLRIPGTIPGR